MAVLCLIPTEPHPQVYYTLNEPGSADRDAMELINHRQVWLCEAEGVSEALTMVAATRRANNVAAITKVFTHPDHRENGYAETLVRYVCGQYVVPFYLFSK
jgi:predicted GNAT family acetyltransferase